MGIVVAAYHLELEQPVAIKFLLDTMTDREEGAERFRREARAAAKIHSDHVVRVLDVGVMNDGVRYMVMEYLEGRDLAEELQERGSVPLGTACGFILEAIDAVSHAHAVGIVHRDLKPANLFLARRPDGAQRVKVLDFGISKTMGATTNEQLSLTKTSAWIGSPLYMAPEQMQSARDVDARADVWSLGAILYELLVGAPPYEAESLPQLCNLLITTDATPVQLRNPQVPDDLADTLMGCLVRDRDKRVSTVGELGRAVARYATTITGSGMYRASMFDRPDQFSDILGASTGPSFSYAGPATITSSQMAATAPSVPAFKPHSRKTPPDRDGFELVSGRASPVVAGSFDVISSSTLASESPATRIEVDSSSGGVHAAWGATDAGQKKRGLNPLVWVAAGLATLLGLGLLVLNQQSGSNRIGDATTASQPSLDDNDLPGTQRDLVPEAVQAIDPPAVARPASTQTAEPTQTAESAAEPTQTAEQTDATEASRPKSKPKYNPRPRQTAKSSEAAAAVAPTASAKDAKPTPKASDEFSEFGGRR